jgi:dihydroorotate dehydrogenase (fumarate)
MASTSVRYLGLELRSPVILSSSGLTNSVTGIRRAAEAGAGAVVLKSLFEEQIDADSGTRTDDIDYSAHPEAEEYVRQMSKHLGPDDYLRLIDEAKRAVDIPVIASVNCVTSRWWGDYGRQIATTGADALELNIAIMPRGDTPPAEIEASYCRIVERVRTQTDIPLAVKIGPYFTSLPRFAAQLRRAGADALLLFNRFYQLDVNIDSIELSQGHQFSAPQEIHVPLRWISILAGETACELVGSTGIHTGADVVKMLLAGATAVQVCTAVYRHGYARITEMNADLSAWMDRHDFLSIEHFRGRASRIASHNPEAYERLQYIKALTGSG